jgi:hypothetical protein
LGNSPEKKLLDKRAESDAFANTLTFNFKRKRLYKKYVLPFLAFFHLLVAALLISSYNFLPLLSQSISVSSAKTGNGTTVSFSENVHIKLKSSNLAYNFSINRVGLKA